VAAKLREVMREPLTLEGIALDLDASIGIAIYPDHGNDAAELLQHADVAMYGAKHTHAGFLVYDPSVDQHSPRRLALLGGLRQALGRDELKIDRSFVMQMATNPSDAVIVHSTIDLGHNLGLRVVAEGVETQAAQERLTVLGCGTAQGYHLCRPMPPENLERWLRHPGPCQRTITRRDG